MSQEKTDALRRARALRTDAARPDIVSRIHHGGKLTARERVLAILDEDSAVEYGAIAARTEDGEWVPETGGLDFVGSIGGQPAVVSSTDYTDHGGGYGAARLPRLFSFAIEHRWPVVLFVDGGGSRARHPRAGRGHHEITGPIGRFTIFDGMAELSGWAPTVAIVSGPAFAGHASLGGFSDFLIATSGSAIGMGGPPMVEAALGMRLTPQELAPVEMHAEQGGIDLLVEDEPAAIRAARRYLGYYQDHDSGAPSDRADDIESMLADGPYDMRPVIEALVDRDTLFELRPQHARSVITALARIDGRTLGVLASQPLVDDAAIDEAAAVKIARFVELCNAYEYPMLSLVDTPGCVSRRLDRDKREHIEGGLSRCHMRPIIAHQQRTVSVFGVQVRRGRGLGPSLMWGAGSERGLPALQVAWPTAETGRRDGFSVVRDSDSFDDVIVPSETRTRIARLLRHLPRRLDRSEKKHPIDSW